MFRIALFYFFIGLFFIVHTQDFPKRIISLGPSVTESLYLLQAGDRLVGRTVFCNRPEDAKSKPKVGNVIDVNIEKILVLKPDLIITTSLTRQRVKDKIKSLGIRTLNYRQAENFQQMCEQFLELGKAVGKEKLAEQIIKDINTQVDAFEQKIKILKHKPKVFIQIGSNPVFSAGSDSFINDLIRLAGGENIAGDVRSGIFSKEEVVRRNPDVIIIAAMGLTGEEEKRMWETFPSINAVQNKKIHIFDPDRLCSPTIVGFVQTLKEISEIL